MLRHTEDALTRERQAIVVQNSRDFCQPAQFTRHTWLWLRLHVSFVRPLSPFCLLKGLFLDRHHCILDKAKCQVAEETSLSYGRTLSTIYNSYLLTISLLYILVVTKRNIGAASSSNKACSPTFSEATTTCPSFRHVEMRTDLSNNGHVLAHRSRCNDQERQECCDRFPWVTVLSVVTITATMMRKVTPMHDSISQRWQSVMPVSAFSASGYISNAICLLIEPAVLFHSSISVLHWIHCFNNYSTFTTLLIITHYGQEAPLRDPLYYITKSQPPSKKWKWSNP